MDDDYRVFPSCIRECDEKVKKLKQMLYSQARSDYEAVEEARKRAKSLKNLYGDLCPFPVPEEVDQWRKV